MKLRTGDKVKFLHSKGEGTVSSIINKTQVMVRTEDGFDVPYLASDLVKYGESDHRLLSGQDDAEEKPEEEAPDQGEITPDEPEGPIEDDEIVFAARLSSSGSDLLTYLVNSSSYHLFYTVSRNIEGEENLLAKGHLEADTKVSLLRMVPSNISDTWKIRVNLLFWNFSFYKNLSPVSKKIELDFSDIISGGRLKENDYFEKPAAIFSLFSFHKKDTVDFKNTTVSTEMLAVIAEKERKEKEKKAVKAKRKPDIEEVDLHIEAITENYAEMSPGEILDAQMARFKTSLETAIIHKTRRMVFIHGIGNGKLKHELRRSLERKYPDIKYQDASFKEYGYGATMVIIPQK